ncbi:MAG: hypothetical protein P4L73_19135 [Caulobacteraceae bacterium]|nr:hypothetical protein [Caulobacteraceae bacterium]
MAAGGLDRDAIARAVIAAACHYGDDPQVAMHAKSPPQRRALVAAAQGLVEALSIADVRASHALGLADSSLGAARRRGQADFLLAAAAAATAVRAMADGGAAAPDPAAPAPPPKARVLAKPKAKPEAAAVRSLRPLPAPQGPPPPLPPDRSGVNHEAAFVRAQRTKRVPWPHIARQIGKSIPDTRRLYDPEWKA